MNSEEVVNVVICYNNAAEVLAYYKELLTLDQGNELGYVVVINASSEDERQTLRSFDEENRHVYVVDPATNLGYINGLLYGYEYYRKQTGSTPRYVVFSNTDIAFQDKKLIDKLLEKKYDDSIACIGPSVLVSELNSYCNPVSENRYSIKQIKKYIRIFGTPVLREAYVTAGFIKPQIIKRKKDLTSRDVYSVHGCYFILTGEYAEFLKTKKYGVLLYSEEIFVAENAYQRGMKTYYDADLEITHKEHSTTRTLKPTKRAYYFTESMKWIKDNYYNE